MRLSKRNQKLKFSFLNWTKEKNRRKFHTCRMAVYPTYELHYLPTKWSSNWKHNAKRIVNKRTRRMTLPRSTLVQQLVWWNREAISMVWSIWKNLFHHHNGITSHEKWQKFTFDGTVRLDHSKYRTCPTCGLCVQLLDVCSSSTSRRGRKRIHGLSHVDQLRFRKIYDALDDLLPNRTVCFGRIMKSIAWVWCAEGFLHYTLYDSTTCVHLQSHRSHRVRRIENL